MDGLEKKFINKDNLPLVITPTQKKPITFNEFIQLVEKNKDELKKDLLKYGGLLFRNFPVSNADEFASFIKHFGLGKFLDYIGGDSPRDKINDGVYTSTEAPPSVKIPLHNELSFVKNYPKHIYFYCHVPPQEKGETIIADSRKIYQSVDEAVKRNFIEKGLKYVSCYYYKSNLMNLVNKMQRSHKSWIHVFETENKKDVERLCYENEFEYKWNQNDWIQISQKRPAAITHPETNEMVWFNQAHLYDFNPKLLGWWRYAAAKAFYIRKHMRLHEIYYADSSKIPRDELYHVLDVLDENTIYSPWQKGDVLVLDNVLAMHGRATFKGKRRVLTAMTG